MSVDIIPEKLSLINEGASPIRGNEILKFLSNKELKVLLIVDDKTVS